MGFEDDTLWWGARKKRIAIHEGLDFVRYRDRSGEMRALAGCLAVPAIFHGEVGCFHRDFLAWSLYIRHPQFVMSGRILFTIFGHVQLGETTRVGQQVAEGEVVCFLDEYQQNSSVPLHLHLTMAWIPENVSPDDLDWKLLGDREQVILIDPMTNIPRC